MSPLERLSTTSSARVPVTSTTVTTQVVPEVVNPPAQQQHRWREGRRIREQPQSVTAANAGHAGQRLCDQLGGCVAANARALSDAAGFRISGNGDGDVWRLR
jgi:hypothetical protein